jgi:HlyD family secretion protein
MRLAMKSGKKRYVYWVGGLVAVTGLAWLFLAPEPIVVEIAEASRGPLEVTVDQEGEVRVHDRYEVTAPVAGKLVRVALHDGDAVGAGDVVAELEPAPLDPRSRDEAIARVEAARAGVREAQKRVEQAAAMLAQERSELARVEKLVAERFVSPEAADKARTAVKTGIAELEAANAREAAARSEEKVAQAALLALPSADGKLGRVVKLTAPVSGRVLRVTQQSERTVPAGTSVMVIGDPAKFEIVADVLSSDAVKIKPGATAWLEEWGGDKRLRAAVRLVEPYAYTKVSALGIEEKRVNVVMDPVDPLGPLGDGYRVEARIVIWSAPDVLKVPASAVFRSGDGWAVFAVEEGRARERPVEVGARNPVEAEIRSGVAAGATVIKYPTNEVAEGVRVVAAKR